LGALYVNEYFEPKLPRAKSANSSFDPFNRQELDLRNQEIYTLHKQGVRVRELAQR